MIYLFAGHHIAENKGTGAHTAKYDEAKLAVELRNRVALELHALGNSFWVDDDSTPQKEQIVKVSKLLKPQDVVIDIHFNAAISSVVGGVEVFVPDNPSSLNISLAAQLAFTTSRLIGSRLRRSAHNNLPMGVKYHTETQHGNKGLFLMNQLKSLNVIICLVEVAFITNPSEMQRYEQIKFELATSYAKILSDYDARLKRTLSI